ncbi:uncharacterized protein LOC133889767 [Phragmites australis]|uniref:uncharacterized protein LOC133889767 n=1 Tax=Phragmites australis TaxID=29695 RepID=UPI002D76B6EB|nr:uncharacterized protein LOC133889767 [Phragmites australis]
MKKQCGGGCLGAPMRALSRACDSACDLYVRGMSGCAHRVPSGAAGAVGRGFGRSPTMSPPLRTSSDSVDDLVRAASRRQRRVAAEPSEVEGAGAGKKGAAEMISAAPAVKTPARKKGAAAMGTIAEDAPCEFGADGSCAIGSAPPRRRGAAAGRLTTRPAVAGFGAIKAGNEVFAH